MKLFSPFRLREIELKNRIVVSPMCEYSAKDGHPQAWHLVHLGSRADWRSGAGFYRGDRRGSARKNFAGGHRDLS